MRGPALPSNKRNLFGFFYSCVLEKKSILSENSGNCFSVMLFRLADKFWTGIYPCMVPMTAIVFFLTNDGIVSLDSSKAELAQRHTNSDASCEDGREEKSQIGHQQSLAAFSGDKRPLAEINGH